MEAKKNAFWQRNRHILYMFMMCLMLTGGFIFLKGNVDVWAWSCKNEGGLAHHPKSSSWSYDSSGHWHNSCTDSRCDYYMAWSKDYASHSYTNGKCVCGKSEPATPTDPPSHTHVCPSKGYGTCTVSGCSYVFRWTDCTATGSYSNHNFPSTGDKCPGQTVTCTHSGNYGSCTKTTPGTGQHNYSGTLTDISDNQHNVKCLYCSAVSGQSHTFNLTNSNGKKYCACGRLESEGASDGCSGGCGGASCGCGSDSKSKSSCWMSITCKEENFSENYAKFLWEGCNGHAVDNPEAKSTYSYDAEKSDYATQIFAGLVDWADEGKYRVHSPCSYPKVTVYVATGSFSCKWCHAGASISVDYQVDPSGPNVQPDGNPTYSYDKNWKHNKTQKYKCQTCQTYTYDSTNSEDCSKALTGNKTDTTHEWKCSVCGHTETESHTWGAWTGWSDANNGKHKRSHTCTVCGKTVSESEPHTWGTSYTSNNNGTHYNTCTKCPKKNSNENCTNTEKDQTTTRDWYDNGSNHKMEFKRNYNPCPKCTWIKPSVADSKTEPHNSNTVSGWQKNASTHWKNLSCSVCGHAMGTTANNNHGTPDGWTYEKNNNGTHKKYCRTCGYLVNGTESCSYGGYTTLGESQHRRTCQYCSYNEDTSHDGHWGPYIDNGANEISRCQLCQQPRYRNHTLVTTWTSTTHTDTCQTCTYVWTAPHDWEPWKDDNNGSPYDGTHSRGCNYPTCNYHSPGVSHTYSQTLTDWPGHTKYICTDYDCRSVKYVENKYQVHFDKNGGTSLAADKTVLYTDVVILPDVTRDGYIFKGWQAYSGSTKYTNYTNTNPMTNGNTVYLKNWEISLSSGNESGSSVVTLVAIWEHDHPVPVIADVTINGAPKDGDGYWCNPVSSYNINQVTSNTESVYYKHNNSVKVLYLDGAVQLINGDAYADNVSANAFWTGHTLTSQASVKASGVLDGKISLAGYDKCTCSWNDTHTSCSNVSEHTGPVTSLFFDGNAPIETGLTSLYNEYKNILKKDYDALADRVVTVTASDVIGSWWSGLEPSRCEVKLTALLNPSITKTLNKTASDVVASRTGTLTFEDFTINMSDPLFSDGFIATFQFYDRAGNHVEGSYVFTGFNVKIEELGSWTFRTVANEFSRGEAVYVKVTTNNYTDKLTFTLPDSWAGFRYLVYQNKDISYIESEEHTKAENLSDAPGKSLTINIDKTEADCEVFLIFLVPENTTLTDGFIKATGQKGVNTKEDSRTYTISSGQSITDGLHTVINKTK